MTYIGEKEIKEINWNDVSFVDGTMGYYTDTQLKYMVTEESKDLTAQRDLLLDNIVPEMIMILKNHNVRKWDIQAIFQSTVWTFNNKFLSTVWKAFWTYREWVHPEYFQEDIRMSDLDKFN